MRLILMRGDDMANRQMCPLCNTVADFKLTHGGNRKYFYCEECSDHEVSRAAERKLATAPQAWKRQLSAKARSLGSGSFLEIIVPNVVRDEGFAYESLRATAQHKAVAT